MDGQGDVYVTEYRVTIVRKNSTARGISSLSGVDLGGGDGYFTSRRNCGGSRGSVFAVDSGNTRLRIMRRKKAVTTIRRTKGGNGKGTNFFVSRDSKQMVEFRTLPKNRLQIFILTCLTSSRKKF